MAQIKVPRLHYFKRIMSDFFVNQFQVYLNELVDSEVALVIRLENSVNIVDAIRENPLAVRYLFFSIGSYGSLGDRSGAEGNLRDSTIYTDLNLSLFFVGRFSSGLASTVGENLSYSIWEDLQTFFREKGSVFSYEDSEIEGKITWELNDVLQIKGVERISGSQVTTDLFTSYLPLITPRIKIKVK